jgi:hypothetical protein
MNEISIKNLVQGRYSKDLQKDPTDLGEKCFEVYKQATTDSESPKLTRA